MRMRDTKRLLARAGLQKAQEPRKHRRNWQKDAAEIDRASHYLACARVNVVPSMLFHSQVFERILIDSTFHARKLELAFEE